MNKLIKAGCAASWRRSGTLVSAGGMFLLLLTCGCMGGGEVAPPGTDGSGSGGGGNGPSGKVLQGAVAGATVFADRIIANGLGDLVQDSSETPYKTVTDSAGHFILPAVPPYSYLIVSRGGTDTLSGKSAAMMLAPSGANNVSALTTMVALDPTLQTKIQALMGGASYDADISLAVTPAALMLAKTIETAVQALTEALNPGNATLSSSQVNDLQLTTLTNLATQVSSLSSAALGSPAALQAAVTTAVTATVTTVDNRYTNISVGSAATVGSNIAATVPTIATAVSGSPTATLSTATLSSEAAQLPAANQNIISSAVNTTVSQNANTVSVTAPTTTPDTTPPTVTATSPVSNVAPNSSITAEFSEPLDLATVTLANFSVPGATGGSVSWNSTSNSVTFSGALPASSTFTVTVSGMKDLAGNTMTTRTWSVTTIAAPDTVNPIVSSTTPAAGASNINYSAVSALFSEAMNSATMNGAAFTLRDNTSGLLVAGAVSYDIASHVISFVPTSKLTRATVYTATISTAAKDQAGNPLAAAVSWSFTTTTSGSSSTVANF